MAVQQAVNRNDRWQIQHGEGALRLTLPPKMNGNRIGMIHGLGSRLQGKTAVFSNFPGEV